MPRGCSPTTESAGWPAMAQRWVSLAAVRAETRGRCRVHRRGKGARKDSCSCFIGQGRERERRPGQLAIDGHGGGRRLYCLHEGKALIRRNGRGIKEGD
jgi:hypothetical protein